MRRWWRLIGRGEWPTGPWCVGSGAWLDARSLLSDRDGSGTDGAARGDAGRLEVTVYWIHTSGRPPKCTPRPACGARSAREACRVRGATRAATLTRCAFARRVGPLRGPTPLRGRGVPAAMPAHCSLESPCQPPQRQPYGAGGEDRDGGYQHRRPGAVAQCRKMNVADTLYDPIQTSHGQYD